MPRETAFGQDYRPTIVDRFGIWLSATQLRRQVPTFRGKRVGDFGCGFHAGFSRTLLGEVERLVLADVALAPDLLSDPKVVGLVGQLPEVVAGLPDASLDVALCISVLEHVWDAQGLLAALHRVLVPGGTLLLNVPSWRGKSFLELSAFRFGLSPASEMDDHKAYYDPKDLWPLLVRAGFPPSRIRCFTHKFGLNTFAVCTRP